MQKISRQALLKSRAELTRRKEHLLMLVPKQLGSESATPLERVFEIIEGTVRIGRRYPSDDSKLETAKVADPASSHFYSGPKLQRERITGHNVKIVECTIRIGRRYPSDDSKVERAKVADPASSHFYSCPKFQRERIIGQHKVEIVEGTIRVGRWHPSDDSRLETAKVADSASPRFYSGPKLQRERLAGHKFGATLSGESKVASQRYECKRIGHFAEECLAQRKQRGRTRNSPGKGNPSERSRTRS
jgi:hypothetical protein